MDRERLERIWAVVARIPRGSIASYGGVAARAGMPGCARQVGRALREAPAALALPWHRVLGAGGRLALPAGSAGDREQRRRLAAEGHEIKGRRVRIAVEDAAASLDRALWGPSPGASRRRTR